MVKKDATQYLCLGGFLLVVPVLVHSQQSSSPAAADTQMTSEQVAEANVQWMRQDIRSQRKKIVAVNLPLTETEAINVRRFRVGTSERPSK